MIIEITIVVLIIILLASSFFALRHKKKRAVHSPKEMVRSEQVLTEDEKKLKELIDSKHGILNELHGQFAGLAEIFNKEGVNALKEKSKIIKEQIDALLELLAEQLDVLDEMVSIDRGDLDYLKHILKKDVPGKEERVHVKNFIRHIEDALAKELKKEEKSKLYDKDDHSIRKGIYNRILEETRDDAIKQGRLLLAFNFIYLHMIFERLVTLVEGEGSGKNKFEGQRDIARRMLATSNNMAKGRSKKGMKIDEAIKEAKDNDIPAINRMITSELHELEILFHHTKTVRDLTEQLRQNEESKKIPRPPYLEVAGHPVEAVINIEDMKRKAFGKGEKISLGNMPEDMLLGSDDHKCLIILGHGMPDHHAALTRDGMTCRLTVMSESKGVFIIRKNEVMILCRDSADKEQMQELLKGSEEHYAFIKEMLTKDTKASVSYKGKTVKLSPGDHIVLVPGYEFDFSA